MTLLPPVRKRTSYADIKADDLVMALFYDRILGLEAMRPEADGDKRTEERADDRPPPRP